MPNTRATSGAGGDDASFVRVSSDDHGPPAQLWLVTLLDACVIGVQVDMNDRAILLHVSPGPLRLSGPLANSLLAEAVTDFL